MSSAWQQQYILNVEDNEIGRYAKTRILQQAGFKIHEATTGQEALGLVATSNPSLVLLDVNLPDISGFEVCRRIKQNPATCSVPVLQVSASFTRGTDRARGLEGGADGYLTEPVEPEVLIATVHSLLRMRVAEEALRESEHRFRVALKNSPILVYHCDRELRYTWIHNPRHGFEPEHVLGKRDDELLPIQDVSAVIQFKRSILESGKGDRQELFVGIGGQLHWYDVTAEPLRNTRGDVVGLTVAAVDITDRKRAAEERENLLRREREIRAQAEAANRVKDEFLATISHELRTPLSAIVACIEVLNRGTLDHARRAWALETIERNARVQVQLIDDLLDVSRIISGKIRLEVHQLELQSVLEAALASVRLAAEAKGVQICTIVDAPQAIVTGDADRLQQVLWNLLSNAIKFTPKGGKTTVRLNRVDSYIEISVADTGLGIGPEFLPHVFERFRQADSSTTRVHTGLGLGLAIVRHLVEMHGGSVRAESGGAGQGSTFTIRLPITTVSRPSANLVAQADNASRQNPTAVTTSLQSISNKLVDVRVLFVDDHPDARELFAILLEEAGAAVRTASSAADALQILQTWEPDVLVSDIGMPGEDGFSLIEQVRVLDSPYAKQVPAVALTGYARNQDRDRVLQAGYQRYLVKPVDAAKLVATLVDLTR